MWTLAPLLSPYGAAASYHTLEGPRKTPEACRDGQGKLGSAEHNDVARWAL